MNKEQKITKLKTKIDAVMKEHVSEYETLADRSEKLYAKQESLREAYEKLDAKTGLNALYEELAYLKDG